MNASFARRTAPIAAGTWLLVVLMELCSVPASAQPVRPADLSTLSPSDFSDDELDLPYYLAHFHRIANSVRMSGPQRGFIDIAVWRNPANQGPHNARVMENILSIAFFYSTDRPWNPYYADPVVRERLEAALTFWTEIQNQEGQFTSQTARDWGIAPTSFAAKFFGEVLRLLESGPPIDARLHERVIETHRGSVMAILRSDDMYEHGKDWANHYTNVWGGALAYLDLYQDPEMERLLYQRFREGMEDFQSPAGYYYEHRGPDFVYDIETEHSNHRMAWHYLRGTDLEDPFLESVAQWYDWLAFNAVLEPNGSGFALNHSIETRLTLPMYRENRATTFGERCAPMAEEIPRARAFCESREERRERIAKERRQLQRIWPNVAPLKPGTFDAYSPYAFLHRRHVSWHPTAAQKRQARRALPYAESGRFTHQRSDDRFPFVATYVRRPPYYAVFASGEPRTPQQRYGLGLIWTPEYGAFFQSHSGSVEGAWGTRTRGGDQVYETQVVEPRYRIEGRATAVEAGVRDLPAGTLSISYPLGRRGEKTITFHDAEIVVSVLHAGRFTEHVPLLVEALNDVHVRGREIRLADADGISIVFDDAAATVVETGVRVGPKRSVTVLLRAEDALTYRIRFD